MDLTAEFEEATQGTKMDTKQIEVAGQVGTSAEGDAQLGAGQRNGMEIGEVRETLSEVLAEAEPNFAAAGAVKTGP